MKTVNPSTALEGHGERSRTIKLITLGCKVNQYETQNIRERFVNAGFEEIDNGRKADIYVVNTCTVTSIADRKSRYFVHYAYRQNPKARIIVTGCYTALDSDEIAKIPGVTHIIKNQDKDRILELLNEPNELNGQNESNATGITNFKGHTRAFLKIQDGCNNFCSYCKVPLVRGNSRSRTLSDIAAEAEGLVKNGFKEIVLSGICLGAYGKDLSRHTTLVEVIDRLENIDGLLRIRLSSIEANDVSDELIQKICTSDKLCPHLHIPLQSGDNDILKSMNRSYTKDRYLNLIQRIKGCIPEIGITTDVLAGFPGEEESNFQNTVEAIKIILPLKVHTFPYSPRKGTSAFNFKDRINPAKIRERILYLKEVAKECAFIYRRQFLNKRMPVLLEGLVKNNDCLWQGFTSNYIKVYVKSRQELKNKLVFLKLKKISGDFILADL